MKRTVIFSLLVWCQLTALCQQRNFFVDGFHGGLYGHYPLDTYTQFMVDQLEQHADWFIGLEIEPETWDTVAVRTPEAYQRFKQKITGPQVEITNPTYAQPYLYNISGESIIRQFQYGMQKLRSHFPGITFHTYSSEEPCFTSQLPQLLRLFGFKYLSLKCPDTCWGGYTEAYGGQLVNLVGPDGSKIIAVPRYACEKLQEGSVWQTIAWSNSEEFLSACKKAGIQHPVGMCYQDAGWTYGPWLRDRKGKTQYVRWTDYIEQYAQQQKAEEWRWSQEDLHPALMWGTQVMQRIGQQVRQAENQLVQAEKLSVLTGLRTNQSLVDEAWRTLMLAQHHDSWIVPYNGLRSYGTWADAIRCWTDNSRETARKMMSEAVATNNEEGPYVTIYNTTAHPRKEVVSTIDGRLLQVDVPAFGYASCKVDTASMPQACSDKWEGKSLVVLENDQYRLTFDLKRGGIISSWIDKQQGGRELVDPTSSQHFGELKGYFSERGGMRSSTETTATATCLADHSLKKQIRIDGTVAGVPFSHTITLTQGQRRVDCKLTVHWNEDTPVGDPYKHRDNACRTSFYDTRYMLRLFFPVDLKEPKLSKDAPFDVCESRLSDTFFNRWDSIKHNIALSWVDLSEGANGKGFAMLTDHTTSYSYGANEPLALTVQYSGAGLWWRRYPIDGPTELNYALVPHQGRWDNAHLQHMVEDWQQPLIVSAPHAHSQSTRSLLSATCQLSAAISQSDGSVLLRLFNADGNTGSEQLKLHFPVTDVVEVDLNGNTLCRHKPDAQGCVKLKMPRFAIKTLKVTPSKDYVNPFIGASTNVDAAGAYHGLGKTFPGATTPFGMVQVSPQTITGGDNGSGYSYEHQTIEGFSMTQMSGIGWNGDMGNLTVMPTVGELKTIAGSEDGTLSGWRSHYDKSTEQATAGYYAATLTDYHIRVEATATSRCGFLRFTFPADTLSRIQMDLARRVGGTASKEYVRVVNDTILEGWAECLPEGGGWGNGEGHARYTVYFHARLSVPMSSYGFWQADIRADEPRLLENVMSNEYQQRVARARILRDTTELEGTHIGFFTEFPTAADQQVEMRVAISYVDLEGARRNFEAEAANMSFNDARASARERWNEALGCIEVEGGTADEKTIFYTALYHTMIDPRICQDVDGRYVGGDYQIHQSDGTFTKRTVFSGWDVFRSQMPLQTIINPTLVNDMLCSLISLAEQSGREYYERWELLNAYSGCMLGNPAISVLADAYAKGIRGYDIEQAYQYAKNSSAKFGNDLLGFTPGTLGLSYTLEYAYTDWCVAQLAKALGKQADEKKFLQKSQAYRLMFDSEKAWFRPRNEDGSWVEWPEQGRLQEWYGAMESNALQQGWFVPHDVEGMVSLMGGRDKVLEDLQWMFQQTPQDMFWNVYYNHANEPVHFVPYLFNQLDAPWLTQYWTRYICAHAYKNKVEGLCGNEDVGQMSAWYVLSAAGIHQACPGNTRFEITSPVFSKIVFHLPNGKTFTVVANNNSAENVYIQSMTLNGKPHQQCYIDFNDIAQGGVLELNMSSKANKKP